MINENHIEEQIDAYLSGALKGEEFVEFEIRIKENPELAAKVEEIRLTNDAIYLASLSALKERVSNDIKHVKYRKNYWRYILPAIGAAAIAIGVWFIPFKNNPDENFVTQPIVDVEDHTVDNSQKIAKNESETITTDKINTTRVPTTEKNIAMDVAAEIIDPTDSVISTEPVIEDVSVSKDSVEHVVATSSTEETVTNTSTCEKSYKLNTEASCSYIPNGSISINWKNSKAENVELLGYGSNSDGYFNQLEAGSYLLKIKYSENCSFDERIKIEAVWCARNKAYSFNPEFDDPWTPILEMDDEGTITIFTNTGEIILEEQFVGNGFEWNGANVSGDLLPLGGYFAIIQYSDGRREKVELTIIR